MKMKNAVKLIIVVLLTISPGVFASLEDTPDIGTFNWNTGDDFSNLNYSLNNWDLSLPSVMTFGINFDDKYGYLEAGYTSQTAIGNVTPTQSSDIIGVRADIRLTSLEMRSNPAAYYVIGFNLIPQTQISLYWGFMVLDGQLEGRLLLYQNGNTSILHDYADFDPVVGQTYNLAMVFDETDGKYYCYLNREKMGGGIYFPDNETSFSSAHLRMYSRNINSRFEFDNIEFATIPEPATLLLMGLGGLIFRKQQI